MRYIQIIILCITVAACAGVPDLFIEPVAGNTIIINRKLESGDKLYISSSGLNPGEIFQFHKCGPGCETATPYKVWRYIDYSEDWKDKIEISEPAQYYFWIANKYQKKYSSESVIKPQKMIKTKNETIFEFVSGTTIRISLNQ